MCEFKVKLNGKQVFEDAIYAKESSGVLILKNILGETRELKKCRIVELDVQKEELILAEIEP
ncbi:MAG: CooT family nickel-binding protein [Candidatus Bathyarchaeia archaeon]